MFFPAEVMFCTRTSNTSPDETLAITPEIGTATASLALLTRTCAMWSVIGVPFLQSAKTKS
jgi:hypothetical protein